MAHKNKETRNRYMRPYNRKYREKNRPKIRRNDYWYQLKKLYGMTRADYDRILKEQNGGCAICERASKKPLCVDHNHETLQIRGLLCQGCNIAVGICEKGKIPAAMAYLLHHSKPTLKVI